MQPFPATQQIEPDALVGLIQQLPALPRVVRYYDDFDDKVRSVRDFSDVNACDLVINGTSRHLNFSRFGLSYDLLVKHLLVYFFSEDLRVSTAYSYIQSFAHIDRNFLVEILSAGPKGIRPVWTKLFVLKDITRMSCAAVKCLLCFMAERHLCGWTPNYLAFIAGTLPLPGRDKYASVRTGDAFLSINEEAKIVRHLDIIAASANTNATLDGQALKSAGILLCSYQFGMRPIQIASLTMRDIRIWENTGDEGPTVHLTFKMVKQRSQIKAFRLTRRIKQDWVSIMVQLYRQAKAKGLSGADRLFEINAAQEVSKAIAKIATEVVGTAVNATDLRHTAAQRLVDAGASQEELAEFMGHSDTTTGLIYYQTSANQAERVNKALGISEVYQRIAKIAHNRFISPDELADLKGEQQVAGVPHGIPIAGIGGCTSGQPTCPFNPVTSCYGCRKFMPVIDLALHKQVLEDMRSIVLFFAEASRGDNHSPAYLQLRRTISHIQQVIAELEEPPNA